MSAMAPLQAAPAKPKAAAFTSATHCVLQRQCACGSSKFSCEGRNDVSPSTLLQRKLAIGASNDPLEWEADRVADQVLAALPLHTVISGVAPSIQRYTGQAAGETATAPASVDRVLASAGKPLEPGLQQDMEQRFGHDFSRVRVHSGTVAEQSARDVNATAYTVGHDIVFGAGRFAPETHDGRRLIAHELTHVVQQSGTDGSRAGQGNGKRDLLPVSAISPSPLSPLYRNRIQRSCASCEARSKQSDEDEKPQHKGFTFEDLLAGELEQGETLLETTQTEKGTPHKPILAMNIGYGKRERHQRPHAGSATIVCESGDYVVKLNDWAGKPCGISGCVTAHENSHIVDWRGRWPKGCKKDDGSNQADGYLPTGGDGYDAFLKTSECTAHTKDLECAADKLKGAEGACKTKWESYIKLTEDQKKSFC